MTNKMTREMIRARTCKYCGNLMIIIEQTTNQYGTVTRLHCETCHGKRSA